MVIVNARLPLTAAVTTQASHKLRRRIGRPPTRVAVDRLVTLDGAIISTSRLHIVKLWELATPFAIEQLHERLDLRRETLVAD